jgi:hypothetical protein
LGTPIPEIVFLPRHAENHRADCARNPCSPPTSGSCRAIAGWWRYRAVYRPLPQEVTDGLDDIQLRELETRLSYLRELRDRKEAVVKAIDEQGKLTPALIAAAIHNAATKQEVEDIYLPFKLKRRTKGPAGHARPGWSRWPTPCSMTPRWCPPRPRCPM